MPHNFATREHFVLTLGLLAATTAAVTCGIDVDSGRQAASVPTTPRAYHAPSPSRFTDADIAAVVMAACKAELKNAEVAEAAAANPEVRSYASRMAEDQASLSRETRNLARRIDLAPRATESSVRLASAGDGAAEALHTLPADEFDRGYVENAIAYQRGLLALLDERLIPQARDPGLKSLLQEVRPTVAAHSAYATSLRSRITAP